MYHSESLRPGGGRNSGIDLLRILAAFYVIVIHSVEQGGILGATEIRSYQFYACQALSAVSFCAVNIFGLISGYVGYSETEKPLNIAGYITLWLEVVFYGAAIALIWRILQPGSVTPAEIIAMCFPLKNSLYWYFSAYTGVFFLSPLMNSGVRHCSRRTLLGLLIGIVLVFSPLETLSGCFSANGGYSTLWLLLLYIVGAIMKKYRIGEKLHPMAVLGCFLVTEGCIFLLGCADPTVLGWRPDAFSLPLSKYTFPLYLIAAMLLLVLFARFTFPGVIRKLIAFAAPGSFAVYLVNVQRQVWLLGMQGRFRHWAASSPVGILVKVLAFSLAFTAAVLVIDYFRQRLFRLLPIRTVLERLNRGSRLEK